MYVQKRAIVREKNTGLTELHIIATPKNVFIAIFDDTNNFNTTFASQIFSHDVGVLQNYKLNNLMKWQLSSTLYQLTES